MCAMGLFARHPESDVARRKPKQSATLVTFRPSCHRLRHRNFERLPIPPPSPPLRRPWRAPPRPGSHQCAAP